MLQEFTINKIEKDKKPLIRALDLSVGTIFLSSNYILSIRTTDGFISLENPGVHNIHGENPKVIEITELHITVKY